MYKCRLVSSYKQIFQPQAKTAIDSHHTIEDFLRIPPSLLSLSLLSSLLLLLYPSLHSVTFRQYCENLLFSLQTSAHTHTYKWHCGGCIAKNQKWQSFNWHFIKQFQMKSNDENSKPYRYTSICMRTIECWKNI